MSTVQEEMKALFRKAVERASLAPSIHNTQPWHFVVRPDVLDLHGDNDRQLGALDPTGRQMVIRTDGVPVSAIPHTDSRFETGGLIRDFDVPERDGCRG